MSKNGWLVFLVCFCLGSLIGSFAAGEFIKYSYEEENNKYNDVEELEAVIDKYLDEYGGTGNVDMSRLFENVEVIESWDIHSVEKWGK